MSAPEIRFTQKAEGALSLLEVTTSERRSVLDLVRGLLFDLNVQIVQVESSVRDQGLVERFEVVELDGAPLTKRRAAAIRSAVRKALRNVEAAA